MDVGTLGQVKRFVNDGTGLMPSTRLSQLLQDIGRKIASLLPMQLAGDSRDEVACTTTGEHHSHGILLSASSNFCIFQISVHAGIATFELTVEGEGIIESMR